MERLQKYLASCGICSRRKAEEYIKEGKVKVNNKVINDLGFKVSLNDIVMFEDKIVKKETEKVYLLLNKPANVITSTKDEKRRNTVVDFIPEKYKNYRIYPVGRLDFNTSGLIILTNDGELTYKLTHPSNEIEKEYQVTLDKKFLQKDFFKLVKGIKVKDYFVKPKNLEIVETNKNSNTSTVKITIVEGKNHEVRDIFTTLGYKVKKLKRIRIAFLDLTNLSKGSIRNLKIHEIKKLYSL